MITLTEHGKQEDAPMTDHEFTDDPNDDNCCLWCGTEWARHPENRQPEVDGGPR